jgi:hypothetical protein
MAVRKQIRVAGQTIWVDSLLEERVVLWLEHNGFSGRWRKPLIGLNVGSRNYTPDIELYIEYEGLMHMAIVEIKPVLHGKFGFNDYIFKRMRIAAKVYFAKILLLYVADTDTWYRIHNKTGLLTEFGIPVPAAKPIDATYRPFTVKARSVGYHHYKQRLDYRLLDIFADGLKAVAQALFVQSHSRRRRKKR